MSNEHPHVLVLCLDTVRKDFYDEYAPRLRERATVRFEEMRAASAWSVPSHAAMLTGELPSQTGLHAYHRHFDSLSTDDSWLTDAPIADYETKAISANVYASSAFGFETLFDDLAEVSASSWFPGGMDMQSHIRERPDDAGISHFVKTALKHDHPLRSLANGAVLKSTEIADQLPIRRPVDYGGRQIAGEIESTFEDSESPTFCFANLMDAHGPHAPFRGLDSDLYDCPVDWDSSSFSDWEVSVADGVGEFGEDVERVRDLYAAEIDYLDRILSDLVDRLSDSLNRDVITIITADHGENLGYEADRHLMNHTSSLTEALLHVPFDVVAPGREEEVVTDYTSLLDLGPIVTNLVSGSTVESGLDSPPVAEIAGSGTGLPGSSDEAEEYWDQARRAVYDPDRERKYVRSERSESVYDVSGAPSTQTCIDASVPDDAFDVFSMPLAEFAAEAQSGGPEQDKDLDAGVESRLEDLGYV